jgi:PAS domain S-box-containing protein
MQSGKKTIRLTLLLLPLIITILFSMLQTNQNQNGHSGISITFYAVMMVFSICIALIFTRDITIGNRSEINVHRDEVLNKAKGVKAAEVNEKIQMESLESIGLLTSNVKDYAIFMIDPDGKVVSWNQGAQQTKGYKSEEIIGQSIEIFYTREDIEKNIPKQNLLHARDQGNYEDNGLRVRKDGSVFWADVVFSALKDEKGQLRGYAKVTHDISIRKKLFDQLHYLAALVDQSVDAIASIGPDGRIFSWNQGAEKLHGFQKEEVIGKFPSEVGIIKLPEDEIAEIIRQIHLTGSWQTEMDFYRKDGSTFFGALNANIIRNQQQETTAIAFIVKDISRRYQLEKELQKQNEDLETVIRQRTEKVFHHEKRFRALIENSYDAILLLDESFKAIYRSPSAIRITGWADEEEMTEAPGMFIHPDDIPMVGNVVSEAIKHSGKSYPILFRCLHKKGHYVWLEGNLTNMLKNDLVNAIVFNARDATQRIESEKELNKIHEELSNYRFALDASSIVSITDKDGIITHVNENFCESSNYDADELIGQDHRMISSGFHSKYFMARLWKTIQDGNIWRGELKNQRKDGSVFWVDTTIVPFLNDEDKPYQYIAIRSDITERKKTEEVLAASENRFRALIENSAEGIALTDEFTNIIYRSPASAKITGILPAENTVSRAHPEDLQSVQTKISETLLHPGVPVSFEGRFQHADGHYFWMEVTLTNMLLVKGVNAIVSNYRDISERKTAEEQLMKNEKLYRSLFENMLSGFTYCKGIFDEEKMIDFIYLAVNDEYELQTGLKELTGKKVSDVNPTLFVSDSEYAKILSRVSLTGKPEKFETYIKRLDKWFSTSVYSPATGYFVGLLDNITERKKAEHKLEWINIELERKVNQRTEELKKKNEEMEAFSYSVSHDLRAPLRGIIGFTTILEEEYGNKLDNEARRITGIIKNNTQKMGTLIDDLLTFSRTGRSEMNKTIVDTNKMVDQVMQEIGQKNKRNLISWIVDPMSFMYGDVSTLHQVWVNLLSNAVKYSAARSKPKIEISSFQEKDQTTFRVKDNGVGFDPAYGDKLFKVFQRLHGTNEFEGSGVGLAIVERIISRHGGKVWAEGEVDKGASFYFSLPVNKN